MSKKRVKSTNKSTVKFVQLISICMCLCIKYMEMQVKVTRKVMLESSHSSFTLPIYISPLQSAIKIFQTVSLKISFKQKIIIKSMSQKGQGQQIMISLNCFVDILNGSLKFDFIITYFTINFFETQEYAVLRMDESRSHK